MPEPELEILARVAELTTRAVIETLRSVPPADRGRWRWRMTPATLNEVRRLPPPNPEAGPILTPPPPGYQRVARADEAPWLLLGRPVELTDQAEGLELAEIPPEPEPDPADPFGVAAARAASGLPPFGRPW